MPRIKSQWRSGTCRTCEKQRKTINKWYKVVLCAAQTSVHNICWLPTQQCVCSCIWKVVSLYASRSSRSKSSAAPSSIGMSFRDYHDTHHAAGRSLAPSLVRLFWTEFWVESCEGWDKGQHLPQTKLKRIDLNHDSSPGSLVEVFLAGLRARDSPADRSYALSAAKLQHSRNLMFLQSSVRIMEVLFEWLKFITFLYHSLSIKPVHSGHRSISSHVDTNAKLYQMLAGLTLIRNPGIRLRSPKESNS